MNHGNRLEAESTMCTVIALSTAMMLVIACGQSSDSRSEGQSANELVGAWLIVESTITTPEGTRKNENPQPGLYIFTERHFSNMLVPREARPVLSDEGTDEERLGAWSNFIANAGSYEFTDTLITTQNIVAKIPNAMDGGFTYRYTLEGDSLVLTFNRGWAPAEGEITYRLRRLE
jgi:hypothetical protein